MLTNLISHLYASVNKALGFVAYHGAVIYHSYHHRHKYQYIDELVIISVFPKVRNYNTASCINPPVVPMGLCDPSPI